MTKDAGISTPKLSAIALSVFMLGSVAMAHAVEVKLSGAEEVPAVLTSATGQGKINVAADKSVSGSISTRDVNGSAAHIHLGAAGKTGPVVITLDKIADRVWGVPSDARLTDAQYKSYEAGDLYVNVHSDKHKDGEIRGQIKP